MCREWKQRGLLIKELGTFYETSALNSTEITAEFWQIISMLEIVRCWVEIYGPKLCKYLISLKIVNKLYWQNGKWFLWSFISTYAVIFVVLVHLTFVEAVKIKSYIWLYKEYFCLFLVWFMNNKNKHLSSIRCEYKWALVGKICLVSNSNNIQIIY